MLSTPDIGDLDALATSEAEVTTAHTRRTQAANGVPLLGWSV